MARRRVVAAALLGLLAGGAYGAEPPWLARGRGGMVASDSPEASRIGAEVLAAGGNAFDAAIATSLALAVARPESTGLGGGGFLVAYVAREGRVVALDFREVAPAGATAERYAARRAAQGDGPPPTIYGGHAVGVPGQLAGLAAIHERYATRPWAELVRPAAALARAGCPVDSYLVHACRDVLADYEKWPQLRQQCAALYGTLLGGGRVPAVGDRLPRPELAAALDRIGAEGADALYRGRIGAAIVRAVQAAGGVLSADDLAGYRVREREPLRAGWHGHEIVAMPPPSSGGVCLLEALNVLDAMAADFAGGLRAIRTEHYPPLLVCALKHAFADRARWLGDPDSAGVPAQRLISRAYAETLAQRFCPQESEAYGSVQLPDDRGTSHFCVADGAGNVVALTETINGRFGSLIVAEPWGIILNNQMDDFATDPGRPNLYGLVQGSANAVAPGRRPLSSMSPTLVLRDGRPVLALGGSGGPLIITSVLQVLVNVVEFGQPLEAGLSAVRLHHQWQPDEVCFDREPPEELAARLRAAGLTLSGRRRTGIVQAIQILPDGTLLGASDPRKGGRPAGVP